MMQRRSFMKLTAATGGALFFGLRLTGCGDDGGPVDTPPLTESDLNAFVRIGSDDTVTIYISRFDMGQGVLTALPMILADELEADWSTVRSEHPIPSEAKYGFQLTGGSFSVRQDYTPMRQAGAAAREMLIAAAAMQWGVAASECRAENGEVIHDASGNRARYGELAELAATLEPPAEPTLKDRTEFRFIGKSTKSLNARAKAEGTAQFGIDVKVPDMLTALVAHSPVFGGTVASFDDTAARAVPGVRDVVQIPSGVAVLADHYWAALKGREALQITWDEGANNTMSTTSLRDSMVTLAAEPGTAVTNEGTAEDIIAAAAPESVLEAVYELPYLAHATMEPLNCVADVRADSVTLWTGTQAPSFVTPTIAQITGVAPENITIHVPLLGGGFGRRAGLDFIIDAVAVSQAVGKPVKLQYSREDDTCAAHYRPMTYNVLKASVDANGLPNAWVHKIVTPAMAEYFPWPIPGVDPSAIEGAADLAYGVPNKLVTYTNPQIPIPVFFWRSVGHSQNAFITECFIDELATLGGKDPLALRLELLAEHPRQVRALMRVAEMSGWDTPPAAGIGRGLAVHESFGTIVAEVAEVSIEDGKVRVHRVFAAVDCGEVINPLTVEAQVESAIVYGLSAALHGEITIENGRPVQSNFHDYPVLRMNEMPRVEVAIIAEGDPIGGMGEPATPPIAPAVCNALFQLTGTRIRKLPIKLA
jgi:isoquinoline 1-oxidoreductase beta subunit